MNIRLASTAVAAAAGAVLLAVAPTATAAAPTLTTQVAPAAHNHQVVDFPVTVKGAQINYRGQVLNLDLTGKATLTVDAPAPGSLKAAASGTLEVSAQHPDLGKITVKSEAKGTASLNSVLTPLPADLSLTTTGTLTIENPGTAPRGAAVEPLVLTTKNPAQLVGKLTQFPPKGDLTTLASPVDLVDANNQVGATITSFPVTVDQV
ncbi:hypothetical protein [Streptomyces sp. V3I7]|uniref:hypothetical protein n=1 Tax=Streptomyces sp. V3I7 TaxID=3042278 RepID=UPI002785F328|nr:hypothetical protein [Streptomyces sp. V3I7]MDQ0994377.1 hypothetical protein [Streptomyces sp. V3I7]